MEDDIALEYQRALRVERKKNDAAAEEERESVVVSAQEQENEKNALNIMTAFDIAGDALGWVPFLGGIVRFIAGAGAVIQSFRLNIAVRMEAWVINGLLALAEIALSFFGLNEFPLETVGALLIRIIASNVSQGKNE